MDDKLNAGEIKENSPFLRWLENFWYHYKVHTIVVLFVLFVVVVCVVQMFTTRSNEDITILYAGPFKMTSTELEGVRGALNAAMPEDFNNDGKKYTEITTYQIMSEAQLRAILASGEDGARDEYNYYRSLSTSQYETYSNMLATGEVSICLLDPWLYERLVANQRVKPISDVFDEIPAGHVDAYGVRLGDTALYEYYDALKILPEDTVVCLLMPYIIGASSRAEFYESNVEMFRGIIEFNIPD